MSTSTGFLFWSATRAAREIKNGSVTSRQLVEASIARIKQVNPAINAVVQLIEARALVEADQFDRMTLRGESRGVLHGVPISIKDSFDTQGVISTGGTMGRKNYIPTDDAPIVARLRAQGAVLVAKTNTPELTLSGETNNLIYGRTSNPFDLSRSPGGSSGGSAALLAAGGSYLDIGSDTGGSIREPAHYCGIVGIKPTSGRTPRSGHIVPWGGGILDSLTQLGPMARYVEDLALTLPIICGPDGVDPSVVPVALADVYQVDVSTLRVGWFIDNDVATPTSDVARVVNKTAEMLKQDGLQLVATKLPDMKQMAALFKSLREAGNTGLIVRLLKRYGTDQPGPDLEGYILNSETADSNCLDPLLIEQIDTAKSRALRFIEDFDVILCPVSRDVARIHGASYEDNYDDWSHTTIQNLLGWPGAVVRAGSSIDGVLPVGVQIIAAPWNEHLTLALALKIESLMGGFKPPTTL